MDEAVSFLPRLRNVNKLFPLTIDEEWRIFDNLRRRDVFLLHFVPGLWKARRGYDDMDMNIYENT